MPPGVKWHATEGYLERVHAALTTYAGEHGGQYPERLEELVPGYLEESALKDPYSKQQYLYEQTENGYVLISLGADQAEGGDEIPNRDIVYDQNGLRH